MPGAQRTAIGITGNASAIEPGAFEDLPGVAEVIQVSKPYKLVSREMKAENTIIGFPGSSAAIGGKTLAMIAGPCAIESREQAFRIAEHVASSGRAIFPRRRFQAAHLALCLPGTRGRRTAHPGRNSRPLRPADRYRSRR
jgi:hypothetical protein